MERKTTLAGPSEAESGLPARRSLPVRLSSWWLDKNLGKEFWNFITVSFLFDSGMFIFFLLYNLYLLDLGFRENFLGWTAGAMALGNIAGSLPCGRFTQRFGLRKTLLVCLSVVPALCAFRAIFTSGPWLLALAFLGGAISSLWAVAEPPVVAQITDERHRAFGFSVVFASGIGFGILAGLVGGYLPTWLSFVPFGAARIGGKRAALLFGCGLAALALWPASRLKFKAPPAGEKRHYPRNRFVFRFFPALAVWSFATGAFAPFFNAYFARDLRMPVERIGAIFAGAQLVQVLAILVAPAIFRQFGLITGIMYTQFACAASLIWLAAGKGGWSSVVAYSGFMGFQWMSEPGMYTLLMTRVQHGERAGASALNLLVISGARAIAASAAGLAFTRFGYPVVMIAVGVLIFLAGCSFRLLLGGESTEPLSGAREKCAAAREAGAA
ncbi:MAG TPA: MFS transporter [Candidatus Acidoferrales bacterium]|nr:MFS transporter [Candidatus Acidoferrales bacterium]